LNLESFQPDTDCAWVLVVCHCVWCYPINNCAVEVQIVHDVFCGHPNGLLYRSCLSVHIRSLLQKLKKWDVVADVPKA